MMNPSQITMFFNLLKASYDALQIPGNPVVLKYIDNILRGYRQFLNHDRQLVLDIDSGKLMMNEIPLPVEAASGPSIVWFIGACTVRKISVIAFDEGMDARELQTLMGLLHVEPAKFTSYDTASRQLIRNHVVKIHVNPAPADHTFSNFGNDALLPSFNLGDEPTPALGGAAVGETSIPSLNLGDDTTPLFGEQPALFEKPAPMFNEPPPMFNEQSAPPTLFSDPSPPLSLSPRPQMPGAPPPQPSPFMERPPETPPLPEPPFANGSAPLPFPHGKVEVVQSARPPEPEPEPEPQGPELMFAQDEPTMMSNAISSDDAAKDHMLEIDHQTSAVRLFISAEAFHTLTRSITEMIKNGNLKKVAASLTMMRRDMTSKDREDRELAFSSYHVVIRALIEEKQNRALTSLIKSIHTDLQGVTELDLYEIHLDTLLRMVIYFRHAFNMPIMTYGLNVLAAENLKLDRNANFKKRVEEHLANFLEPEVIKDLLSSEDPEVRKILNPMLESHGPGLVRPMLYVLYESDNRNTRKRLLEAIRKMGTLIYPILLAELHDAIEKESPWFVIRNLLTLLAVKTPTDIGPMLVKLREKGHPKLQDLITRCIFQIPGDAAFEMGKSILLAARGRDLSKVLGYIVACHDQAYAPVMMDLFRADPPQKIKLDIIHVLARLNSRESLACLAEILATKSRFRSDKEGIRVAAAKALAHSSNPQALAMLTKFSNDKDKEVKAIVRGALDVIK